MTEHGRAPAGAAPEERHGGSVLRALYSVSDLQLSVLAATPERMLAEVSSSVLYKRSPTRPPTPLAACWPPMPRRWPRRCGRPARVHFEGRIAHHVPEGRIR